MNQMPNVPAAHVSPVQQENMMHPNMMNPEAHKQHMLEMCRQCQHHFVQLEGTDGNMYEGIIDGTDDDHVEVLVPAGEEMDDYRQYPYWGGYPYSYGFGYPRRFRRFRRHRLPFFGLRRIFFPFFY